MKTLWQGFCPQLSYIKRACETLHVLKGRREVPYPSRQPEEIFLAF